MKKTTRPLAILFLGIVLLITNGCAKQQGPAGPAGPAGNVNVTSNTYTVSSWSWSSPYYYVNLSVPALTSSNINSAAVMAYFNVGGSWLAMPYTQYNSPSDYYMGFNTSAGNVQVTWVYDSSLSSGSNPNTYYGATVQCKVVVIPPAAIKQNPNLDLKNYKMVKEAFNLKD